MAELRVKGTGTIKLFENDNTSNVTIASPASLGADRTITLPDASVTLASGTMNDATNLSGTVPIASGGTGLTTVPYFLVEKTSNQTTVADNTYTQVTFESEIVDNGNNFASNTFTAPVTGYYYICANITITGTGSHVVSLFYKNDGGLDDYRSIIKTTDDTINQAQQNISALVSLSASDTVKVYAKMNTSGGTCTFGDGLFSGFQIIG
jgi:hypothetical protein